MTAEVCRKNANAMYQEMKGECKMSSTYNEFLMDIRELAQGYYKKKIERCVEHDAITDFYYFESEYLLEIASKVSGFLKYCCRPVLADDVIVGITLCVDYEYCDMICELELQTFMFARYC